MQAIGHPNTHINTYHKIWQPSGVFPFSVVRGYMQILKMQILNIEISFITAHNDPVESPTLLIHLYGRITLKSFLLFTDFCCIVGSLIVELLHCFLCGSPMAGHLALDSKSQTTKPNLLSNGIYSYKLTTLGERDLGQGVCRIWNINIAIVLLFRDNKVTSRFTFTLRNTQH